MPPPTQAPSYRCPNCGADGTLPAAAEFFACAHCGSTLFADPRDTVVCLYAAPRARSGDVVGYLRKFLSERELRAPVEVKNFRGMYLPFWRLEKGRRALERPAFALALEGLQNFKPPAEAKFERLVHAELENLPAPLAGMEWLPPEIGLDTARAEWERLYSEPAEGLYVRLRSTPVYTVEYEYEGAVYRAAMDAVTGEVLPEEIPPSQLLALDRKVGLLCATAGAVFVVEGVLIPHFLLALAACAATGVVLYPVISKALLGGSK